MLESQMGKGIKIRKIDHFVDKIKILRKILEKRVAS